MALAKRFEQEWRQPSAAFRSAPFWSWNARLDPDRLGRAIESMGKAGFGGFFMHSRYGLKTPYLGPEWFTCVTACVEKARALKMKAYLYDEDRWPSGAAGGAVTRPHPQFRMRALQARDPSDAAPEGAEPVARFAVRLRDGRLAAHRPLAEGQAAAEGEVVRLFEVVPYRPGGWQNDGTYLDTMNPKAVAEFLRITHQAYAARYRKDFGKTVPAIFTDEPNYGHNWVAPKGAKVPWTGPLLKEFKRRRGYDLAPHLPALAYRPAGEEFSPLRADYFRTITELFVEAFSRQIGRWCGRHRLASTGHMLMEETLWSQIAAVGDCMPHYEHMQWPGIDILCDQADELSTAKQCSSVADQLGKRRVLSELYGCTGWDWPLEGHKFVGDWHLATGVNLRCPHLTHYSLEGGAKRDYPASLFDHSPWWKHFRGVEDYFARLTVMLTQGRPVRDVLVLHPVESAWGVFDPLDRNAPALKELQDGLRHIVYALSGQHYDWDFGDESLLARHARVRGAALAVGRMAYRAVVVPPAITLRSSTVRLLKAFAARGGKVLFAGRQPDRMNNKPSAKTAALVKASHTSDAAGGFIPAMEAMLARRVSITEGGREADFIWAMLRRAPGMQTLFLQSHDRKRAHHVRVSVEGRGPVARWDAATGARCRLKAETAQGRAAVELDLPPTGSALLVLGPAARAAAPAPREPRIVATRSVVGPFAIERTEPNTMPLDYAAWRIADGPWSEPVPVLKADELIRRHWGLAKRSNGAHQPWYLYATGVVDLKPRGRAALRFTFHVSDLPRQIALAVERPQDFRITLNGRPAAEPSGWWVDEDIRTVDLAPLVQEGENELLLEFDFRPDMELEDLHLVGEFGVRRRIERPAGPGGWTLAEPPAQVGLGSWVGQGLDFYGGSVVYRFEAEKPRAGRRLRIALPGVRCTAAALRVGGRLFFLPWAPFAADVTDAMAPGMNAIEVEVIGGRKNILGPLHTPWGRWTGPSQFDPDDKDWRFEYYLNDHGLMEPVILETLARR